MKKKLIRVTTVSGSFETLLSGQLEFMSDRFDVVCISSSNNGRLERYAKSQGVRSIAVHLTRSISPIQDLVALWNLYWVFRKEKPDIVHTHTPKAGTIGMLAAYLANVKNRMHTIAGLPLLEATGFKRVILNIVEKMTYRFATKIYPNSFGLKDIVLKEKFTSENKLEVLGNGSSNGINLSHFNPDTVDEALKNELKQSLDIAKDDFVFVFVGRMVRDKGIIELIDAFEKVSRDNNSVKLLLVGAYEQDLDPLPKSTLEKIEHGPQIIQVGWQTDIRPYLSISNALVFPSYREGFPNVVMQAGAMGIPSIVSDINGCNEIILENINGHIIPVKDTQALIQAMYIIRNSVQNDSSFDKETIRKMIADRYDQQKIWRLLLDEYKTL